MNVAAELEVPAAALEERRANRAALNASAGVRRASSASLPAQILDLSTTGFRARLTAPVAIDTVVWLKLPGLEAQQGRVVWAEDLVVGCVLTAPLHPAVFDHIVRQLG